jgi:hypothetical protein
MSPNTLRLIPTLAVVILSILLLAPHLGRGEDAAAALAGFQPFMPGNPIPEDVECEGMSGFYDSVQVLCRTEGGPYCERGYMVGREGVIIHTTFYRCNFPVAYLVAEYGRYEEVRRYSAVLVLRWSEAYAHVRREGWLNSMQPVSIVTWWKPPEPVE